MDDESFLLGRPVRAIDWDKEQQHKQQDQPMKGNEQRIKRTLESMGASVSDAVLCDTTQKAPLH